MQTDSGSYSQALSNVCVEPRPMIYLSAARPVFSSCQLELSYGQASGASSDQFCPHPHRTSSALLAVGR
jgi:hypothetical protein